MEIDKMLSKFLHKDNKDSLNHRLTVIYDKGHNKAFASDVLNNSCLSKTVEWVRDHKQHRLMTNRIADAVFRLDFDKDIFVFKVNEDLERVVLSGYMLPKNTETRMDLAEMQADYLLSG